MLDRNHARRAGLIAAAFAALAMIGAPAPASAASQPGRLEFDVSRNGQPFGRHIVTVERSGDALVVSNRVNLRASVGPVVVYRYDQTCTERWVANALTALDCSTNKNGRRTEVTAQATGSGLRVEGPDGARTFPADVRATTWWTRTTMQGGALLDTETGEPMRVQVTRVGRETIDVGGQRIEADRYRLVGTLAVDLWYDDQGRWVSCAFTARGQRIEYRLASPLAAAPA
jgi:hypothetical protein